MLIGWQDALISVFEIVKIASESLLAVSLVDEMTYRVYSNVGRGFLRQLRVGYCFSGRLAPVGDNWLMSGAASLFTEREKPQAYQIAYKLSVEFPDLVFCNPVKREEGFKMQREDYNQFVAFFGTDSIAIPSELFDSQMRAYMQYKMTEARGEDGLTVKERVEAAGEKIGEIPEFVRPAWADDVETIGALCDERTGVYYMPDYGMLEAAFEYPELVK